MVRLNICMKIKIVFFHQRRTVTRWLDHFLDVYLFTPMKICPTASNLAIVSSKFAKDLIINPLIIAKDLIFIAKVAKFRQIWSLCNDVAQ